MTGLYKNCGITGKANFEISSQLAYAYGQACGLLLKDKSDQAVRVLIAKDTRASGDMISSAVAAGFCSVGVSVVSIGIIPAPALSYLIKKYKMNGGAMISVPKLTAEYSGICFFDSEGKKFDSDLSSELNRYIESTNTCSVLADAKSIGRITSAHTGLRDYVDYVKSIADCRFRGIKLAIDGANGAACESAKLVFKELGADVEMMHNHPDGFNINENCGCLKLGSIQSFVPSHGCDLGIAFDGAGTDFAAVDEKGHTIDARAIERLCGCEASDFSKNNSTGDAIAEALLLVRALCMSDKPMSELTKTEE